MKKKWFSGSMVRKVPNPDTRSQRRPRRSGPVLAAVFAIAFVAGCAPLHHPEDEQQQSERVLAAAFENVDRRYVREVPTETIALTGLRGLAGADTGLGFETRSRTIGLSHNGVVVQSWPQPAADDYGEWAQVVSEAIETAQKWSPGLGKASREDAMARFFRAGFEELDRYTVYATPDEARNTRARREGFGGIGITIRYEDGRTFIRKVHPDTPAEKAGLKAGDRITHVGDLSLEGLSQHDVVSHLRGPVHSRARLTVVRDGLREPLSLTAVRAHIILPTVTATTEGGLLILKITGFNQGTARAVGRELAAAESDLGRGLKGLVLDLRSNPGGLLDQAVAVADFFLNDGRIISTRGRHRRANQIFDASWGERVRKLPIAILINGRSASASEIVAAALRDRARAIVIGASSFGKGSVQTIIHLPNGGELTLTWAHMIAPSGFGLQSHGIIPAVCTSGAEPEVAAIVDAIGKDALAADALLGDRLARRVALRRDPDRARAACPPSEDEREADMLIARHLLERGDMYARAIHDGGPAIAQQGAGF